MQWEYSHPTNNGHYEAIQNMANYFLGNYLPGIGNNVAKIGSLYSFIVAHAGLGEKRLSEIITQDGKPLFTPAEMKNILGKLKKARVQTGGESPKELDPSRNEFWDRIIRKTFYPITSRIPAKFDGLLWYMFILYNLEQIEVIGPFIAMAMDTVTLSLPVIADMVEEFLGKFIALAPIPYASFAGEAIGYVVSLFIIIWAIFLNFSRRHFGSAFKASLEALPFIGEILSEGAMYFETGMKRYIVNRNRLLGPMQPVSPSAYAYFDYYVPSDEIHLESAPSWNFQQVKKDVARFVLDATGARKYMNAASALTNPAALVQGAVGQAQAAAAATAQKALTNATAGVQKAVNSSVGAAVAGVQTAAANATAGVQKAVNSSVGAAVSALPTTPPGAPAAKKHKGGRQTRRRKR